MSRLASFLFLPGVFLCTHLMAQEAQPASSETTKKSTVEGQVFNLVTKEAVKRAEVQMFRTGKGSAGMAAAMQAAYSATTDAEGKFKIENVEPGEYRINYRKAGFLGSGRGGFGMSAPASSAVTVKSGETHSGLKYYLTPQGILAGRVIDDEGEPVQGAMVMLMRWTNSRGVKSLTARGRDTTNDRGEYRISDVPPGRYFIQVNWNRGTAAPQEVGGVRMAYVATLYPNASDPAQATRIQVTAGLELGGQDITMRREKVVKVSGKLLEPDGSPAKNALVGFIATDTQIVMGWSMTPVDAKGGFKTDNVRPGNYNVIATRMDGSIGRQSAQSIQVGDTDIDNVTLQLQPPMEASGTITVEAAQAGSGKTEVEFTQCWINAEGAGSGPLGGGYGQVTKDGTFKLEGLMPGRLVVNAQCGAGESYVKSILVGDEDVLGKEVDAGAVAAAGVKVILRTDTASVSGTLDVPEEKRDPTKQPRIVLIPADARLRRAGVIEYPQLDQNYQFNGKTVRPGEYLAYAFAEADNSSFDDPEFYRLIESKGVKVKLGPGESQTVDLKLTAWPAEFADRLQ